MKKQFRLTGKIKNPLALVLLLLISMYSRLLQAQYPSRESESNPARPVLVLDHTDHNEGYFKVTDTLSQFPQTIRSLICKYEAIMRQKEKITVTYPWKRSNHPASAHPFPLIHAGAGFRLGSIKIKFSIKSRLPTYESIQKDIVNHAFGRY